MNILLEKLKKGSGIHIKESQKGSFTRWCGGNVTEECIRKGKNSSNPKIRKKATFADNARHFKHRSGGKAFVNGVSVLDSNPNAYKQVKKKVKMRQWGGDITINESPIVLQRLKWLQQISDYNRYKDQQKYQQKIAEEEQKAKQRNDITNTLTGIFEQALPYLTNSLRKKSSTSSNNAAPSTNIGNTGVQI